MTGVERQNRWQKKNKDVSIERSKYTRGRQLFLTYKTLSCFFFTSFYYFDT